MAAPRLSTTTEEALSILGSSIRVARLERGWTIAQLAERVGVSPSTMRSVEQAKPGVAIGTVFEAATLVGVPLFHPDPLVRAQHEAMQHQALALLPTAARRRVEVDDDF